MNDNVNMAQRYEHEIPEGYEAKIEGGKVIIELKESEDERIRRDILEALSYGLACEESILMPGVKTTLKEATAYLEKQKEQKEKVATEWPNMSNCPKNCKKCLAKCFYRKEQYEEKKLTDLWSEEDYKMIESINMVFDACAEKNIATEETTLYKLRAWLKSLPERINLLPRQEWSEENENMLKTIFDSLETYAKNGHPCLKSVVEDEIAWLKSLRPQPIQKWSKEDEKMQNKIIGHLSAYIYPNSLYGEDAKECIEWLKSLRPQPKQDWSEEDEEMLKDIIHSVNGYDAITGTIPQNFVQHEKKINWLESIRPRSKAEWSEDYCDEDLRIRFAFYTYKDEDDVLYLSNVFVDETSRNKGFGTKILAAAEKVAETIGATNIRLKVKQDNPANAWYREHGYSYMVSENGYDWLEKTLEYLKPTKSEWSEEDESYLQTVISEMEANKKEAPEYEHKKYETIILWLKSLRPQPHWKPSEEQMKILRKYVMGEWRDLTIGQDKILTSLYIDLEKL